MNIAMFHTTLPEPHRKPGGVEIAVHRLANALETTTRHRVTVFSLTPPPEDAKYRHEQLYKSMPSLRRNRFLRLLVLPLLLNFVRFDEYDILHLHGDDWFYISRLLPTVRTFHGSALEEARSADSWKRRLAQYCVYPLEHLSNRLSTRSAAVGPKTSRLYDTPHLVNNGVDLSLFTPGAKTEAPSILFVGTWKGRKRGQFLFQTFVEEVFPRIPEARLYMVADRCDSHEQVSHVPRPTDEELAALYRKAWVFAYPSIYEGFGIPYLEAMASGTAVLCSPNDGAQYVLDDGTYGVISRDEVFGDRLVQVLSQENYRRDLVERGLARARKFSWEAVAERHANMYQQVAHNTSAYSTSLTQ